MGFFGQGLFLGLRERRRWIRPREAVELAVVFLDFFFADGVDDLGSWVDTFLGEVAFDFISVGFELGVRDLREGSLQSFHGSRCEVKKSKGFSR